MSKQFTVYSVRINTQDDIEFVAFCRIENVSMSLDRFLEHYKTIKMPRGFKKWLDEMPTPPGIYRVYLVPLNTPITVIYDGVKIIDIKYGKAM